MNFELLKDEIQAGLDGRNAGIPMGFNRLDKYIGLRKRIFTTVFGGTGCHSKGALITMYDGTFKKVEEILIGDLLMGPDSLPRKVLELKRGREQMYTIKQNKGISYIVNESHVLHLRKLTKGCFNYTNITVRDYLKKSKKFKHLWKGYKVPINFKEHKVDIDPYFLGLWLGDGTSCKTEITTTDSEIIKYLEDFCKQNDLLLNQHKKKDGINFNLVTKTKGIAGSNSLLNFLKNNNLLCNKHIPDSYLKNSVNIRLELLAGLIDSDGYIDSGGYGITLKNEKLSKQIVYLSRSLGFYTSIKKKVASMKRNDGNIYTCDVFKIGIFGNDLSVIPIKIDRKKYFHPSTRKSDCLSTGFTIEKMEIGDYYGFVLDGDHLYLLEDFTVTHNTGKTAYVHNAYILQPFDYLQSVKNSNMKMKVILFSMERSKIYTLTKWLSRKIFLSEGILIPIPKLLGWWDVKLTKNEHDLVLQFEDYINELSEFVDIIEGANNPTGIYRYVKNYAEKNGKFEKINEFSTVYIPNESNELVVPIIDHYGLTKPEKGMSKKEAIDKVSEYCQYFRDVLGYSPVGVSQINRDLSSFMTKNITSFEPTLDHIKESGRPAEDSDVVISLFQPSRYKTEDTSYRINKFIDSSTGGDYFRSLKILKNSYGEADVRCGMGFMGATGIFTELPKAKDMENFDYNSLFNHSYFLK